MTPTTEVHVLLVRDGETEYIAGVYRNKIDAEAKRNEPGLIESCHSSYIDTCKLQ